MSLMKLNNALRKRPMLADQRGLSTVEYVIILAVIAIVAIGVWSGFGQAIQDKVNEATTAVSSLPAGDKPPK